MSFHSNSTPIEELLQHSNWLRDLARSLVRDPQAADDLVQATWSKAMERPPQGVESPRNWLGRLLRNTFYADYRAAKRRVAREQRVAREDAIADQTQVVERGEINRLLADAVMELDEPYRTTILMRFHEGRSAARIARQLGIPASTVRSHLKRGLEQLRRSLSTSWGKDWNQCSVALLAFSGAGRTASLAGPATWALTGIAMIAAATAWVLSDDSDIEDAPIEAAGSTMDGDSDELNGVVIDSGMGFVGGGETLRMFTTDDNHFAQEGDIEFKGRVVDESGQPLAGATVKFHASPSVARKASEEVEWENPDEIITEADGLFELIFPAPPKRSSKNMTISAPGRVSLKADWELAGDALQSHDFGDVTLTKGAIVHGQVICDEGALPSKMAVHFEGIRGFSLFPNSPIEYNIYALTDEQGNFRTTEGLPPGNFKVDLSEVGYTPVDSYTVEIPNGVAEQHAEFHINQLPAISGRVELADGTVPGRVYLEGIGAGHRYGGTSAAWSNSDGSFTLPASAEIANESKIAIKVSDHWPVGVQSFTTEAIYSWGEEGLVIQLQPTLHLDIQVVDDATGAPIENYAIVCKQEEYRRQYNSRDLRHDGFHADGKLRIDNLSPGTNVLKVLPTEEVYVNHEYVEVQPTHESLEPLVVRLVRMIPVPIRLTTQAGTPIQGSTISLLVGQPPFQSPITSATTDENGMCDLLWPPSHGAGLIRASGNHTPIDKEVGDPIGLPDIITIVADEAATVSGNVAMHSSAAGNIRLYFELQNSRLRMTPDDEFILKPDENNDFEITLAPGKYHVIAMYPNAYYPQIGFGGREWFRMAPPLAEIVVGEGDAPDLNLDATHLAPAQLHGTLSLDGQPAANMAVNLVHRVTNVKSSWSTTLGPIITDAYGRFEVKDIMPGTYAVLLDNPGDFLNWLSPARSTESVDVNGGETKTANFEVFYRELKVRPLHPDTGLPMPGTKWNSPFFGSHITDEEGWFYFAPAPQEKVRFTSKLADGEYLQTELTQVDMNQLTTVVELGTTRKSNNQ